MGISGFQSLELNLTPRGKYSLLLGQQGLGERAVALCSASSFGDTICHLISKILPNLKEKKERKKMPALLGLAAVPMLAAVWLCNPAILALLVKTQPGAVKAVRGWCLVA